MAPEKLRLPKDVRTALKAARDDQDGVRQKELAHTSSVGHFETGERPVSKPRFWKLVKALGKPETNAVTWWRWAIQARVDELLIDGGMTESERSHVRWAIVNAWPRAEDDAPQQARTRLILTVIDGPTGETRPVRFTRW